MNSESTRKSMPWGSVLRTKSSRWRRSSRIPVRIFIPTSLPGSEVGINILTGILELLLHLLDFVLKTDPHGMLFRVLSEFIQLTLQFNDRLLKIELMFHLREVV